MRAALFTCLVIVVAAACGDEHETKTELKTARPTVIAPADPPVDRSLGAGFEMGGVVRDGRIVLVPIVATGELPAQHYVTLQDAMARRQATVREMPGEMQVDLLRVHNGSELPMFVMSGELVLGGQQDRALAETRIIAPGRTVEVGVRCVERGREYGDSQFHSGRALVELSLRQTIAQQLQSDVWNQVAAINVRLHTQTDTETYRHAAALQQKSPVADRRDRLVAELAAHPDRQRMVGIAIAIDGTVIAIDRFATPELFQAVEGELVASYVASDVEGPHEGRLVTPEAIRRLAQLTSSTVTTDASFAALRPLDALSLDPTRDPWE